MAQNRWNPEYQQKVWEVAEYAAEVWHDQGGRGPAYYVIDLAVGMWIDSHPDDTGPCVDTRDVEAVLLEAALGHICSVKKG